MYDYIKLRIDSQPCTEDITDLLAAFLADIDFESFVPDEKGLYAYVRKEKFDEKKLDPILNSFPIPVKLQYLWEVEKGKDWNEEWEKNYFTPILIDDKVVIHSSFHKDIPTAELDLTIDPKMAFGTGHHATTTNMVRLILKEDMDGAVIIDMGTGTGILGMICSLRGARKVYAIEIDPFAADNAAENCKTNKIEINLICGDASALKEIEPADYFLANINRNIILEDLSCYAACTKPGGKLMLSGFYSQDIPMITQEASRFGFRMIETKEQNNWVAIKLIKDDF